MKPFPRSSTPAAVLIVVVLLLAALFVSAPKYCVALIRVVDAAGQPIAGASIEPDGLRTKPGPYESGHYGWRRDVHGVPNDRVIRDTDGYAPVPYPKYVLERLETGQISFRVGHPEYVADRPFRVVATTPPSGTPWRVWRDFIWDRLRHNKTLTCRPDPVVLQKGAILKISVRPEAATLKDSSLFAQVPKGWSLLSNFWIRTEPGAILTRQLAAGTQAVRAVQFTARDVVWFSEVTNITAVAGRTNELVLDFKPGVAVRGQLDPAVPRPVANGRVIAHVWPLGHRPEDWPPDWHAWTAVGADGRFELGSLPAGDLEIVALCQGFVSTNGREQPHSGRYPQKHRLGTNDVTLVIGMEPTARLEVLVTDDQGKPLKDARVFTGPNVRYGDWMATLLGGDCINTADTLRLKPAQESVLSRQSAADFQGTTDRSGRAVLADVPANVTAFDVEHPRFALPAMPIGSGLKRRQASVTLIPGATNHVSVQLEPRGQAPIAHF